MKSIVFIERKKMYAVNRFELEIEQLIQQMFGACNRKLFELFGIVFEYTILLHLRFWYGHFAYATHLNQ